MCCKDLGKITFQKVELNESHIIHTCSFHYAIGQHLGIPKCNNRQLNAFD